MADYPLGSLVIQIREHWRKYRPKMYAELEESSDLAESLHAAQERTSELMYDLQNGPQRLDYQAAWELAREEWAFLPSARRMTTRQRTPAHDMRDDARPRPRRPHRLLLLVPDRPFLTRE